MNEIKQIYNYKICKVWLSNERAWDLGNPTDLCESQGYLEGMTFENPKKRSQPLTIVSLIHSRNSFFSAQFVSVLVADRGVENEMLFLDFILVKHKGWCGRQTLSLYTDVYN